RAAAAILSRRDTGRSWTSTSRPSSRGRRIEEGSRRPGPRVRARDPARRPRVGLRPGADPAVGALGARPPPGAPARSGEGEGPLSHASRESLDPGAAGHGRRRRIRRGPAPLRGGAFRFRRRRVPAVRGALPAQSLPERCDRARSSHPREPGARGRGAPPLRAHGGAPGRRPRRFGRFGRAGRAVALSKRARPIPLALPLGRDRAGARRSRGRDPLRARHRGLYVEEPARALRAEARGGRIDRDGRGSGEGAPALPSAPRALSHVAARAPRARAGARDSEATSAVSRAFRFLLAAGGLVLALSGGGPARAELLVPMDPVQTDHLRAYGLTYWALQQGFHGEWLLNFRGGSFLLPDNA